MNLLITEFFNNNLQTYIIDLLSILSILSAIFVIISKNPIVSVLYLIVLFVNISLYLITLGIQFLGLTYILIYVGAIAILFLYIIMLLNIKISELQINRSNPIPLGLIIIIMFLVPIFNVFAKFGKSLNINNNQEIFNIYQPNWELNQNSLLDIQSIGNIMYTEYGICLIITSLILLLSMVGCIVLTKK